jgi:hypothetical protein
MTRVMVCTPTLDGRVDCEFVVALNRTADAARLRGTEVEIVFMRSSEIWHARNSFVDIFLKSRADVLCQIDADESWTVEDFEAVLAGVQTPEAPIVAAPVALKRFDWGAVIELAKRGAPLDAIERAAPTSFNVSFDERQTRGFRIGAWEFLEVAIVGAGLIAARRDALEKIAAVSPRYRTMEGAELAHCFPVEISRGYLQSEDQGFCRRARQAGLPIHVFSGARVSHHGSFAFGSDFGERLKREQTIHSAPQYGVLNEIQPITEVPRAAE